MRYDYLLFSWIGNVYCLECCLIMHLPRLFFLFYLLFNALPSPHAIAPPFVKPHFLFFFSYANPWVYHMVNCAYKWGVLNIWTASAHYFYHSYTVQTYFSLFDFYNLVLASTHSLGIVGISSIYEKQIEFFFSLSLIGVRENKLIVCVVFIVARFNAVFVPHRESLLKL